MENKSIKVIDEHNIDRVANVICAIDVDGSDYVVYSIERDSDNDNIFVSKLVKNINETSNVVNIDDSMEKDKISSLVKELIKYANNNNVKINFIKVDSLDKAKNVPCVFNNWANFYKGEFISNTILNANAFEKVINKK